METVEMDRLNALILRLESELQSKGKINSVMRTTRELLYLERRERKYIFK